jgi:hypothetical protein
MPTVYNDQSFFLAAPKRHSERCEEEKGKVWVWSFEELSYISQTGATLKRNGESCVRYALAR